MKKDDHKMPSKTALVSFIGLGQRDRSSDTYLATTYDFGAGVEKKASVFCAALLESGKYTFDRCVLVGTVTSTWATLLECPGGDSFLDLYTSLETERENGGVGQGTLVDLQHALAEFWQIPVVCHAHAQTIEHDNAFDILAGYFQALALAGFGRIVIDITHGFRSMPVLLMSALQLRQALSRDDAGIEIVYGEFNKEGLSPVRYLDAVWHAADIAMAVSLFFGKFDGNSLADALESHWPEGAKAVRRLGSVIQANFVSKLDEALRQLANAFDALPHRTSPPWAKPVHDRIRELHTTLSSPAWLHERIFVLAGELASRHLYGQAIICLQLAVESFVLTSQTEVCHGDYEGTKRCYDAFIAGMDSPGPKSHRGRSDRPHLQKLRKARNAIAHGGALSAAGGSPHAEHLPKQFEAYSSCVERLFRRSTQGH